MKAREPGFNFSLAARSAAAFAQFQFIPVISAGTLTIEQVKYYRRQLRTR